MMHTGARWRLPSVVAALLLAGCTVDRPDQDLDFDAGADRVPEAPPAEPVTPPIEPEPDMRLEVDISARELHVYRGGQRTATHPVAVGSEEWPTRTGEWTVDRVVWNPRWVPPDEEWAEGEEVREVGDPENPLGRAQLPYDGPRSIHGTDDVASLGRAVSHGSIRVSNEVAMELARDVMEAGGADRGESWYQRMRDTTDELQEVPIPRPIPIRVHSGG